MPVEILVSHIPENALLKVLEKLSQTSVVRFRKCNKFADKFVEEKRFELSKKLFLPERRYYGNSDSSGLSLHVKWEKGNLSFSAFPFTALDCPYEQLSAFNFRKLIIAFRDSEPVSAASSDLFRKMRLTVSEVNIYGRPPSLSDTSFLSSCTFTTLTFYCQGDTSFSHYFSNPVMQMGKAIRVEGLPIWDEFPIKTFLRSISECGSLQLQFRDSQNCLGFEIIRQTLTEVTENAYEGRIPPISIDFEFEMKEIGAHVPQMGLIWSYLIKDRRPFMYHRQETEEIYAVANSSQIFLLAVLRNSSIKLFTIGKSASALGDHLNEMTKERISEEMLRGLCQILSIE